MIRVDFAERVADDFDRITEHLIKYKVPDPHKRISEIVQAIHILAVNPCIGRLLGDGSRELVTGRDYRGYLVRYRYLEMRELVFVEAIRSQREAGYAESSDSNK